MVYKKGYLTERVEKFQSDTNSDTTQQMLELLYYIFRRKITFSMFVIVTSIEYYEQPI